MLLVGLLALVVMAPALPEQYRSMGAGGDKSALFVDVIEEALGSIGDGMGAGRALTEDLLRRSGGWDGGAMPWAGLGSFSVADGQAPAPEEDRRVIAVMVRVEDGTPIDVPTFASQVMAILNDPRGWGPIDGVSFARTDEDAAADIVITLASPATTEDLCGELPTRGYTSCGRGRPVNINGARWVEGAEAFMDAGGGVEEYRRYVINHEIGHSLGHPHEQCAGAGQIAPVMMQQTLSVGVCVPNGWPRP